VKRVAQTQRFADVDGSRTWTVVGGDGLPVDWIEEYFESLRMRIYRTSPNTIKAYARGLGLYQSFLDEVGLCWREADLQTFDEFVAWLRDTHPGQQDDTYAARVDAVVSAYRWHWLERRATLDETLTRRMGLPTGHGGYRGMLHHLGNDRATATIGIRRRRRNPRTPVLAPAQVHTALTFLQPNERDHLLFATLAETGARVGEVLNMRHLDWHTTGGGPPFVLVEPQGNAHPRDVRGKLQSFRQVYISADLARAYDYYVWTLLERGLADEVADVEHHYVFVNLHPPRFRPTGYENVRGTVNRLKTKCSDVIPSGFTAHWLRHTHAAALLLSGAPIHVVAQRLGHADVQTTMRFYGWIDADASLRALSGWQAYVGGWSA
jgi:site-specific recombinase XerD